MVVGSTKYDIILVIQLELSEVFGIFRRGDMINCLSLPNT